MWIIKLALILRSLKGRCYSNQLILETFADVEIDCFHSSLWRSEMECTIALRMHALIVALKALHRVISGENRFNNFIVYEGSW